MDMCIDENSTRNSIVMLLKKQGGMSIEELSKVINITPMGIRQHLLSLEKKGLVSYVPKRRGIGRPGFVYMLTTAADELFPKSYDEFALGMLRDIRSHDGPDRVDEVFGWRRERLLKNYAPALAEKENTEDLLQGLKGILEAEGHFVDISKTGNQYRLKQYHCPISKVAGEFSEACRHELQLYKDLIGRNITREQTATEGSPHCVYLIPKA